MNQQPDPAAAVQTERRELLEWLVHEEHYYRRHGLLEAASAVGRVIDHIRHRAGDKPVQDHD